MGWKPKRTHVDMIRRPQLISRYQYGILKRNFRDGLDQDWMVGQKKVNNFGSTFGQHFAINTSLFIGIYLPLLTLPIS
jgi:hypothetical protein